MKLFWKILTIKESKSITVAHTCITCTYQIKRYAIFQIKSFTVHLQSTSCHTFRLSCSYRISVLSHRTFTFHGISPRYFCLWVRVNSKIDVNVFTIFCTHYKINSLLYLFVSIFFLSACMFEMHNLYLNIFLNHILYNL